MVKRGPSSWGGGGEGGGTGTSTPNRIGLWQGGNLNLGDGGHGSDFIAWDEPNDPAPEGAALTWDDGDPTVVTCAEDGRFDVTFGVMACPLEDGTGSQTVQTYLIWDDDSVGWAYYANPQWLVAAPNGSDVHTLTATVLDVPLTAGQTLKLYCAVSSSGPGSGATFDRAWMTVSKRA